MYYGLQFQVYKNGTVDVNLKPRATHLQLLVKTWIPSSLLRSPRSRAPRRHPLLPRVHHAAFLRISLEKGFIVGGDSAGANLATVCAIIARDNPFFADRRITGQLLRQQSVI
ncbi:hypothetical protein L226DRAFT_470727 [Lentinus tigrinus ALCF2SS1-7]|uniref:Uncharacterized protein n=1 Tax=Lentinus tigrinus ALCF2SS1-6 TaxID=1328759 RepID=A0A5C2RTZ6_9APHY|nr:hypothetical protein L227DRAFT_510421 [Lentinus tigrinus ALCF2SS1-6]RPD70082.1 hypothetical protein L226DRAFT_470727 [Lentinus tigrinus ALCF2SS1-7]